MFRKPAIFVLITNILLLSGCSRSDLKLAPVDGVVTYNGTPLANATITFVPEKGPIAMGTSDKSGRFKLSTGARPGAVLGRNAVAISVGPAQPDDASAKNRESVEKAPKSAAEAQNYLNNAGQIQKEQAAAKAKSNSKAKAGVKDNPQNSPIPSKYMNTETSGLIYTIEPSGKTGLKIELN